MTHKLFKSKYIFITKFKKYPKRIDAEDVTLTFYAFLHFATLGAWIQNIVIVQQRATIKSIDENII